MEIGQAAPLTNFKLHHISTVCLLDMCPGARRWRFTTPPKISTPSLPPCCASRPGGALARSEGVKKSLNEQKHFTPRRKVAKDAKRIKELFFASLCAQASWRENVYFSIASLRVGSVKKFWTKITVWGNIV
jgi:hypothetical protein